MRGVLGSKGQKTVKSLRWESHRVHVHFDKLVGPWKELKSGDNYPVSGTEPEKVSCQLSWALYQAQQHRNCA